MVVGLENTKLKYSEGELQSRESQLKSSQRGTFLFESLWLMQMVVEAMGMFETIQREKKNIMSRCPQNYIINSNQCKEQQVINHSVTFCENTASMDQQAQSNGGELSGL